MTAMGYPRIALLALLVVPALATAHGCVCGTITSSAQTQFYSVEIDVAVEKCGWKKLEVYYESQECGCRSGAVYDSKSIGTEKEFRDHISLKGPRTLLLTTKEWFKETKKVHECPPGKVLLIIDGRLSQTIQPTTIELNNVLRFKLESKCKATS
jgi:hypothetical protein